MLAIFNLFHPGQGGKITVQDIATYTTSAFRVMFKLQPSLETEVGALAMYPVWEMHLCTVKSLACTSLQCCQQY